MYVVAKEKVINGYEFQFSVGAGSFGYDGVTLDPETTELANPHYLASLEIALKLYSSLERLYLIELLIHGGQWAADDTGTLDRYLSEAYWALQQTDWEMTAYEREHLQTGIRKISEWREKVAHAEERRLAKEAHKQRPQTKNAGYVYLIESAHGVYKIGLSKNPENRMATFGVKLPFPVEYCCLIQTDDMRGLEAQLHERYASKRVNGEWFNLDADDVAYIKSLAQVQS